MKVKKKAADPGLKGLTKGITSSKKDKSLIEAARDASGGMAGKRQYLKKGENPIKPNLSGKEYEGPTSKYEKKPPKKKGRKSLRKLNKRLA